MKKTIFYFMLLPLFLNGQINSEWKENLDFSGSVQYLGILKNCSYSLVDTSYYDYHIYKSCIDSQNVTKISRIYKPQLGTHHYFKIAKLGLNHYLAGENRFNFVTSASIVNLSDTTKSYSFFRQNKSSIFIDLAAVDSQLIALGYASYSDPTLTLEDSFDELIAFKFNKNLALTDSVLLDLEAKPDKSVFLSSLITSSGLKLFSRDIETNLVNCDIISNDFKFNYRINYQIDSTENYFVEKAEIFNINGGIFGVFQLAHKSTNILELSFGLLGDLNFKELKRIKTEIDITFEEPTFEIIENDGEILFSIISYKGHQSTEKIGYFYSIDTLGETNQSLVFNVENLLAAEGVEFKQIYSQIILDSTLIIQGNCHVGGSLNQTFYLFLKPPFSHSLFIDSLNEKKYWGLALQTNYLEQSFTVLGLDNFGPNSNDNNLYFEKLKLLNFTSKIQETQNPKHIFLKVYPNPTSSNVNFTSTPQHLWVYNTTGALVYQNPKQTLNLNLPNGMYFLQAQFEEGLKTQTLIIQQQ